jgi:hypothetical protein
MPIFIRYIRFSLTKQNNSVATAANLISEESGVVLTYNARKMIVSREKDVSATTPIISEQDYKLLASIENERVGNILTTIVNAETESSDSDAQNQNTVTDTIIHKSDILLHMHSFCGNFGGGGVKSKLAGAAGSSAKATTRYVY